MDEIKLVDLRKENLNTVKEAIKLASSMGAAGFKLYVNPNFIKTGLVSTRIVPISGELPPKSQLLLNFAGLKNLKNTIEFAKKILGDAGEVDVKEVEPITSAIVPAAAEAPPLAVEDSDIEPEQTSLPEAEELTLDEIEDSTPEILANEAQPTPVKASKKNKKKKAILTEEGE